MLNNTCKFYCWICVFLLLLQSAFAENPIGSDHHFNVDTRGSIPEWALGRDANGDLQVDSGSELGVVVFEYERSSEDLTQGFPVGHGLPDVENRLFYNMRLDGYGGFGPGNCLQRAEFISDNDPAKPICAANENDDILRNWSNQSDRFRNVLFKNIEAKNAIRTINNAPGPQLPHTDTFQSFQGPSEVDSQWLVIQDSIFRNSDNSLMIVGTIHYRGFVYQNLRTSCDGWFIEDARARVRNDYINAGDTPPEQSHHCTNAMGAQSFNAAPVWLIDVEPGGGGSAVRIDNQGAPVIIVGFNSNDINITDDPGTICRYQYLEDALSDEDTSDGCGNFERPPFIELSCSGWLNAPANCTSHQGSFFDEPSGGGDPQLLVNKLGAGNGTVTGDGIDCGADCSEVVAPGTIVTLTAIASGDSIFSGWSGGGCSGTADCVVTVDNNVVVSAIFSLPPQPELIAHYPFTTNANDVSGNAHHAVLMGAVIDNGTLALDGIDDQANAGTYMVRDNALTLMAWIKVDSLGADPRIISKSASTTLQDWVLGIDDGPDVLDFRVNTGVSTRLTGGSIELDEWTHVTGVYDGNTMRIYKNAIEVASQDKSGNLRQSTDTVLIGDNMPGAVRPFDGHIDDVRVYSVALSQADILDIFTNTNPLAEQRYSVGGIVTGLISGNSLVLQNNGIDDLVITSDGSFTFGTPLIDGSTYIVTVQGQPTTPNQTCTVTNASGSLVGADVENIVVVCQNTGGTVIFNDSFEGDAVRGESRHSVHPTFSPQSSQGQPNNSSVFSNVRHNVASNEANIGVGPIEPQGVPSLKVWNLLLLAALLLLTGRCSFGYRN